MRDKTKQYKKDLAAEILGAVVGILSAKMVDLWSTKLNKTSHTSRGPAQDVHAEFNLPRLRR